MLNRFRRRRVRVPAHRFRRMRLIYFRVQFRNLLFGHVSVHDPLIRAQRFPCQRLKLLQARQLIQVTQSKPQQKLFRRLIQDRPTHHFLAPRRRNQLFVQQRRNHWRSHRLLVRNHRQRLQRRHRKPQGRPQRLDKPPHHIMVLRLRVHLVPARHRANLNPALFHRISRDQLVQRRLHRQLLFTQRRRQLVNRRRLIRGINNRFQCSLAFFISHLSAHSPFAGPSNDTPSLLSAAAKLPLLRTRPSHPNARVPLEFCRGRARSAPLGVVPTLVAQPFLPAMSEAEGAVLLGFPISSATSTLDADYFPAVPASNWLNTFTNLSLSKSVCTCTNCSPIPGCSSSVQTNVFPYPAVCEISMSIYKLTSFVITPGSSQATAASSSHKYSSSEYFPI